MMMRRHATFKQARRVKDLFEPVLRVAQQALAGHTGRALAQRREDRPDYDQRDGDVAVRRPAAPGRAGRQVARAIE
jgi:hypothetical protein